MTVTDGSSDALTLSGSLSARLLTQSAPPLSQLVASTGIANVSLMQHKPIMVGLEIGKKPKPAASAPCSSTSSNGHQGVDVADDLAGRAAVALDDAEHVALGGTFPVQADRRQQQTLGK